MTQTPVDYSIRDHLDSVNELFFQRWSPRAYLPDAVDEGDLATMVDAARWSPSCFNEQPWLFYTSTPQSYDKFLGLLVEANQAWAKTAPVIGFMVANTRFARNGKENFHAAFDTGAAWMAMSLQAKMLGLHTHGMGGIHYEAIYEAFGLDSQTHQVICGFTVGRPDLSADEEITERKPLSDIWRVGL